jgi:hypothetical protein
MHLLQYQPIVLVTVHIHFGTIQRRSTETAPDASMKKGTEDPLQRRTQVLGGATPSSLGCAGPSVKSSWNAKCLTSGVRVMAARGTNPVRGARSRETWCVSCPLMSQSTGTAEY